MDGTHTPHHKLIIGAIRGEGMAESKNFFQATVPSRFQGQNVTHEMHHSTQEPKSSNQPTQSTHSSSKTQQPPRNVRNVKFQNHEFTGPYHMKEQTTSITNTTSQYRIDNGFQHLISSLNMAEQN